MWLAEVGIWSDKQKDAALRRCLHMLLEKPEDYPSHTVMTELVAELARIDPIGLARRHDLLRDRTDVRDHLVDHMARARALAQIDLKREWTKILASCSEALVAEHGNPRNSRWQRAVDRMILDAPRARGGLHKLERAAHADNLTAAVEARQSKPSPPSLKRMRFESESVHMLHAEPMSKMWYVKRIEALWGTAIAAHLCTSASDDERLCATFANLAKQVMMLFHQLHSPIECAIRAEREASLVLDALAPFEKKSIVKRASEITPWSCFALIPCIAKSGRLPCRRRRRTSRNRDGW